MKKRTIRAAVLALLILAALTGPAYAGPEKENGRWYYRDGDGGRLSDTFVRIDGSLYYFGSDGALVTDCPVEADGGRFFCDESGRCLTGQWRKCRYPGETAEHWYYYLENGKAFVSGWLMTGGSRYHFTDRHMDTGWYAEETGNGKEAVYYLGTDDDGKAAVGWLAWKGDESENGQEHPSGWYYFLENGRMVCDTELAVGDETYAFNGDGSMAVGFCRVTGSSGNTKEKYFDRRSGCRAEGWLYLNDEGNRKEGWYYFAEGEVSVPEKCTKKLSDGFGTSLIDGSWYGFDGSGRMITGLYAFGDRYYCFGSDGKMKTGVVNISQEETDTPDGTMLFLSEGSAPPAYGASAEGIINGILYKSGCRVCAQEDLFEQIELETEKIRQSYVVSNTGSVIRSATVTLQNGRKMKIIKQEDGWKMVSLLD